jgi:hypothetical protein
MKLKSVHVENFKSILHSTEVSIQDDVTCIVGKNESGKTAFLSALYRLNPVNPGAKFEVQRQYPAWLEKRHRREGRVLEDAIPVTATFALLDHELAAIAARFGPGTFTSSSVTVGNRVPPTALSRVLYSALALALIAAAVLAATSFNDCAGFGRLQDAKRQRCHEIPNGFVASHTKISFLPRCAS